MIKLRRAVIESLQEYILMALYGIKKGIGKIVLVAEMLLPVVLVYANKDEQNYAVTFLITCVVLFVLNYIKRVGDKINRSDRKGMPIPKRYIEEDGGMLLMREKYEQEAIQYLYDLQEYFKKRGEL